MSEIPASRVKIIADSTCDLGAALIARHDISIVPLYVTLGDESYLDGVELSPDEVIDYCERTKETPKTAASSVGDLIEAFRPHAEAGRDIVFLSISAHMSAENQNARIAAKEFPGRVIRCVDSRSLSTGVGLLVVEAAKRAEAGMGADRIADEIEALTPKVSASFVLDTLTYLRRGGRCSGVTAMGAAMLNIKPQISVEGGEMSPTVKFRGNISRVVERYIKKELANIERIRPDLVFITHSPFPDEALRAVLNEVRGRGYFQEIVETTAGCVVTSHCGPGTLGILYIRK